MKVFEKVVKLCMKLTVREESSKYKPHRNPKSYPQTFQKLMKLAPMLADMY